jgi:UPF0755 protein
VNNNRKNKTTSFLIGLFLLFFAIILFFIFCLCRKSSYIPERNFIVEQTDDDSFSRLLVDKKISNNFAIAKLTIKIMRLFRYRTRFGEYSLPEHVSLLEAIKIIDSGSVVIHKITIPEGFSVLQVMRRLEKDENLLGEIESFPPEGSLMPDTYCFKYPTQKKDIIHMAKKAMKDFIKCEWPKRSPKCFLKNSGEALILASIVEKETNVEKEKIAGVYLRRLKIDMKLQSCPTAIYAHKKGDKLGHQLKYSELTIADPHNTYVYKGLPPTPISNPGKDSIIAVLHPEETDDLFFVCDRDGKHVFAKTYDEHKRNIAKVRHLDVSEVR